MKDGRRATGDGRTDGRTDRHRFCFFFVFSFASPPLSSAHVKSEYCQGSIGRRFTRSFRCTRALFSFWDVCVTSRKREPKERGSHRSLSPSLSTPSLLPRTLAPTSQARLRRNSSHSSLPLFFVQPNQRGEAFSSHLCFFFLFLSREKNANAAPPPYPRKDANVLTHGLRTAALHPQPVARGKEALCRRETGDGNVGEERERRERRKEEIDIDTRVAVAGALRAPRRPRDRGTTGPSDNRTGGIRRILSARACGAFGRRAG
jgi:hypothetical protein